MRREYAKQQTIGPVLSAGRHPRRRKHGRVRMAAGYAAGIDSRCSRQNSSQTSILQKRRTDGQRLIFRECLIEGKASPHIREARHDQAKRA